MNNLYKKNNLGILIILFMIWIFVSCAHHTKYLHSSIKNNFLKKLNSALDFKKPIQRNKFPINKIVRNLHFFPINGERFQLSELKAMKAIVVIMREKNCPISEKYGLRLVQLEKKYSKKGIKFIYNYVGQQQRKINAEADLKKFRFTGSYSLLRKNYLK